MIKLPKHKCSLTIQHNPHKDLYETAEQWLSEQGDCYTWEMDETREQAIEDNEIWTLQWYPDTQIVFIAIAAPTIYSLFEYAEQVELELHG